jgi:hypothetical protein
MQADDKSTTAGSSQENVNDNTNNLPTAPVDETTAGTPIPDTKIEEPTDNLSKSVREESDTLKEITMATSDLKFKEELTAIESWFKVLSRSERTASIYTLLQNTDQDQKKTFIEVLERSMKTNDDTQDTQVQEDAQLKAKPFVRGNRPPSLDLPDIPRPPVASAVEASTEDQDVSKAEQTGGGAASANGSTINIPGVGVVNTQLLNMAAASGLSTEAQMLAIQLVMSGLVQPATAPASQAVPKSAMKKSVNWRAPGSAKYPGSALRHNAALRSAGLKSSGLRSAVPDSALEGFATPKEEDFDPEVLDDIPTWLRGLRLHKYTQCFDRMTWQEMVVLDEDTLEKKGIVTLGARRRLMRTFEIVRKKMGMENDTSATPTEGTPKVGGEKEMEGNAEHVPPDVGKTKLSVNSPVFVPKSALVSAECS